MYNKHNDDYMQIGKKRNILIFKLNKDLPSTTIHWSFNCQNDFHEDDSYNINMEIN